MTVTVQSKMKNKKTNKTGKSSGKLFEVRVYVTLKQSVLDPQGKVILQSLHRPQSF